MTTLERFQANQRLEAGLAAERNQTVRLPCGCYVWSDVKKHVCQNPGWWRAELAKERQAYSRESNGR